MHRNLLRILLSVNCLWIINQINVAAQIGREPPKVVSAVVPKITPRIRMNRQAELVAVDVVISGQGKVEFVQDLVGSSIFAKQSVVEAVKQWKFDKSPNPDKTRSVVLHFNFKPIPGDVPEEALQPDFKTPYALELRYKVSPRLYLTPETYADRHALTDKWCQIHRTSLRKDLVEIVYGLLGENPKYDKVHARLFPHDATWVGGGCVIETNVLEYEGGYKETLGPPMYAEVEYCTKCRAVRTQWLKNHPPQTSTLLPKKTRSSR
jgi:hypothetical protein